MRQYISQDVVDKTNELLVMFFKMNSFCDNAAYALDCELECQKVSNIYHQGFAHIFPSDIFADKLSDDMVRLNMRPIRKGFEGDSKIYSNIVELFKENLEMMDAIRNKILNLIDEFDTDINNKELVLHLEEMSLSANKYLKISYKWLEKAEEYFNKDDIRSFNIHFEEFAQL